MTSTLSAEGSGRLADVQQGRAGRDVHARQGDEAGESPAAGGSSWTTGICTSHLGFVAQGGLATGPVGKYIITPLELADGSVVFVNRGWAPRNSSTWNQPKGRVSITGVKTGMEVQKTFSPPNFPFKDGGNIFWLEEPAMKVYAGMDPAKATAYVQLVDEKDHTLVLKGNEDFKKFPVMPETHLGYAATWLGLCCFGVIMTIVRARG
eukprot:scaffold1828_cov258-Pinguiococcus_pyrenoidosus.AAC.7